MASGSRARPGQVPPPGAPEPPLAPGAVTAAGGPDRPLLEIRDLCVRFATGAGVVQAVSGLCLRVDRGATLALVGESGAGKTTAALAIMRLLPPPAPAVEGQILLDGRDLLALSEGELRAVRGKRVAMVFQDAATALNPVLSVGLQLAEPLRRHEGLGRREARRRAADLLRRVGLPDAEHRLGDYPHRLSGGQRQRVMIALALACGPEVLLADEPTSALDVTLQVQILDLIREVQQELGCAVLLITHDLGVAARAADRMAVMYAGRVVEEGPVEEVFARPGHPYTWGLLAASPGVDRTAGRGLVPIPGQPPSPVHPPSGCAFHPRCRARRPECSLRAPALRATGPGHLVACVLDPDEAAAERARAATGLRGREAA
jgi:oligopeptide/dipeptide ABC transporter ATP-binding protein